MLYIINYPISISGPKTRCAVPLRPLEVATRLTRCGPPFDADSRLPRLVCQTDGNCHLRLGPMGKRGGGVK